MSLRLIPFASALVLATVLTSSCCSPKQQPVSTAKTLFNGRDLTGWHVVCKPADRDKTFWTVQDGAIFCDSIGRKQHDYVWLMSDDEFGDFELTLEFQVYRDSPGNSGLQFRSRYDTNIENGWLHGPQVDIHPLATMPWRTGLIYDETREERRWIHPSLPDWRMPETYKPAEHALYYADDPQAWNRLVLVCHGMKIQTYVNGILRTDWDATGVLDNEAHRAHNVGSRGHFALQLHSGDELRIKFRNLRIKEL
jgi:hypothetical protein